MAWVELKSPNKYLLNLDFDLRDQTTVMQVKQYDTYKIDGYLFSNGIPQFIDSGFEYFLRVRRPDNKVIFATRDLSSSNYESFLRFNITAEMTEIPGHMLADVAIYEILNNEVFGNVSDARGANETRVVQEPIEIEGDDIAYLIKSTQPFTIEVLPSPGPIPDGIASEDGYQAIGGIGGSSAHVYGTTLSFSGQPPVPPVVYLS